MKFRFTTFSIFLFFIGIFLVALHSTVVVPPRGEFPNPPPQGIWIDHETAGIHHAILKGKPYERGYEWGRLTTQLLKRQEEVLNRQLQSFFPQPLIRYGFLLLSSLWLINLDHYIEPDHLQEMYGVSQWAPHEFDEIGDPLTRQVAYHGLHEVGQLMVDKEIASRGCTAFGLKGKQNWIVGRNFDFSAGTIFDEEKVLKWVFPDTGIPFVSVTWAGMVGVVTGVNAKGVYGSMNAAGSSDRRRIGTPSTLVLLKALQNSSTAEEAAAIVEGATVFIADIYLFVDQKGTSIRVEKTPHRVQSTRLDDSFVISNHLESDMFVSDKINQIRKDTMTTMVRKNRGLQLLAQQGKVSTPDSLVRFLRDHKDQNEVMYPHADPRSINNDAATHSTVYDVGKQIFYVSQGPNVSNAYLGFDLTRSFQEQKPVQVATIP